MIDGDALIQAEAFGDPQFKIVFTITIDFGGSVSYGDISIYNLSQSTADKAFKRGSSVGLRAGYRDAIDYIFNGRIVNILRERDGNNTITRLIARGGSQDDKKSIEQTFGENTPLVDIIKACAGAMGYPLVIDDSDFSDVPLYIRGYVLNGDPRVYMDKLSDQWGFQYTIDNEKIVVVGKGSSRQGSNIVVSEATGMESIPEVTENGVDVTTRLNPKLKIGKKIDVVSEFRALNFSGAFFREIPESAGAGTYKIYRLIHSGDSWGDAWSTKITGFNLDQ